MKTKLEESLWNLKNPFMDFYFWVKGEQYDIMAM